VITAANGTKKVSVTSDEQGRYRFADLDDGQWKIEIKMHGFSPAKADVTIAPHAPPGNYELTMLPPGQLTVLAISARPSTSPQPAPGLAVPTPLQKRETTAASRGPIESPSPSEDANQESSSDGFLVNGSVNNAATSEFSLPQGFGNRRSNSKSLYKGELMVRLGDSTFDAQPFSLSGHPSPRPHENHVTGVFVFGGPIKIPRLVQRGAEFFFQYQLTRDRNAAMQTGLVPTGQEREGNFAGLVNALGMPVTLYDPATGKPYPGNVVPVSSQAQSLLNLYPRANIQGNALYNYQVLALNTNRQDAIQTRLLKRFNRSDVGGSFNPQLTQSDSVNLFGFVDKTNTLGINANIGWLYRFNDHVTVNTRYQFSWVRTQVIPEFAHRRNISGDAGITGNDQDPADWGPPALNFSSGIAALSDGTSSFNRDRTDGFTASLKSLHGRHNITVGGDLRKQQYNYNFQQNPRGVFTFTGAATAGAPDAASGFDLADFLVGVPDTSSIAFGNAGKYLRQTVYDVYANDDWRILPTLSVNAGVRWEYASPMTEVHGRLVNLDVTPGFTAARAVLGVDPVGALTGERYPVSLLRPDWSGLEPRIGIAWRPIRASTLLVRAGYGVYRDTSVYRGPSLEMAQQWPFSKSLHLRNSAACPLTLATGFNACSTTIANTFGIDPNFRVGYAQVWQLSVQRDLPGALQMTATYLGTKGTNGVQEFLPNTYPIAAVNPCPDCPAGFVYRISGGNSARQSGSLQVRHRLRSGFAATVQYTWSKSIDNDSILGGPGQSMAGALSAGPNSSSASPVIAQNWRDLRAERSLSYFDQRHLLNVQAQYTSGQGFRGGTLMGGWPGSLLKEWSITTQINAGSGLPQTLVYPAAVPGTGLVGPLRPSLTGAPIHGSAGAHLNAAAYTAPTAGEWGNAARNSIVGPDQFSLDGSLQRTFRLRDRYFLDARIDAVNLLNHPVFTGWNTTVGSTQFGQPAGANAMRSLKATLRLRF